MKLGGKSNMKLRGLIFAMLFAFAAIPCSAFICHYTNDEMYTSFYSIFKSKRGDDIEFIKFCYEQGVRLDNVRPNDRDGAFLFVPTSAAKFNRMLGLKFFMGIEGYNDPKIFDNNELSKTALHFAALNGNYEMTKYLLEKGASPIKKDNERKYDALDYAKQSGVKQVIDLVEKAWRKSSGLATIRQEEYKKEIKSINMNDYEKFKLKHNLNSFKVGIFLS